MRRIVLSIIGFMAFLSALWLLTGWGSFKGLSFFGMRDGVIQLSGVLSIALMTIAVILSTRPRWLESFFDGVDKTYRLHKWAGIVAFVIAALHWFMASGFKILISTGILAGGGGRPGGRPVGPPGGAGTQTLIQNLTGPAHFISEWAFYAMVALIAISLLTLFAYWFFALSHRLFSIIYIALAFHCAVLFTPSYWLTPIGIELAILLLAGTIHALLQLFHIPTHIRRVHGSIASIDSYPELNAVNMTVKLEGGWKGHKAGQFAFIKTTRLEAPHPFTIASDWHGDGKISFVIKSLGDYTSTLSDKLAIGGKVKIEGPYGRFDFADNKTSQIWIGAGIGITPFIAGLKQLQRLPGGKKIYLFHPTSEINEEAFGKLREDASVAGAQLFIQESRKDGHLTAERIMKAVPDWKEASVWFCGPSSFMKAMRREFRRAGLRAKDFHNELFEMR